MPYAGVDGRRGGGALATCLCVPAGKGATLPCTVTEGLCHTLVWVDGLKGVPLPHATVGRQGGRAPPATCHCGRMGGRGRPCHMPLWADGGEGAPLPHATEGRRGGGASLPHATVGRRGGGGTPATCHCGQTGGKGGGGGGTPATCRRGHMGGRGRPRHMVDKGGGDAPATCRCGWMMDGGSYGHMPARTTAGRRDTDHSRYRS